MADKAALVLVVDDNEMNRDMLARRLQRQQCEVIMAEDGLIALDMVRKHPFDLILLDIMMPNLSGYEVLERLKQDEETRPIPVIMISAVDDLDSVVKCIELGADDYLFKPFNPVLLKARVSSSLNKRQLQLSRVDIPALRDNVALIQSEIQSIATAISGEQKAHLDRIQDRLAVINELLK
jgi:DNA-binding response OmpR family regulator